MFARDSAAGNANYGWGAVLAEPFGSEPVKLLQRTKIVCQLEPLLSVGIKRTQMAADELTGIAIAQD